MGWMACNGLENDAEVLPKSTSSDNRLSVNLRPPAVGALGVDQNDSSAGSVAATGVIGRFGGTDLGLGFVGFSRFLVRRMSL